MPPKPEVRKTDGTSFVFKRLPSLSSKYFSRKNNFNTYKLDEFELGEAEAIPGVQVMWELIRIAGK